MKMKLDTITQLNESAMALANMRKTLNNEDMNGPENIGHVNQVIANTASKIDEIVASIDIQKEEATVLALEESEAKNPTVDSE